MEVWILSNGWRVKQGCIQGVLRYFHLILQYVDIGMAAWREL